MYETKTEVVLEAKGGAEIGAEGMNTMLMINPKGRRGPSRSDKDEKSEVGRLVMKRVGAKVDGRSDKADSPFGTNGRTVRASRVRSAPSRKPDGGLCWRKQFHPFRSK